MFYDERSCVLLVSDRWPPDPLFPLAVRASRVSIKRDTLAPDYP